MLKWLERAMEAIIFSSRWIQAPLYLGLIAASVLYCYKFMEQLWGLCVNIETSKPEELLLGVLGLVDVTMVANLIFMVVIGGYTIFVSQLNLEGHEDRPEWLEKTNAASLKIKLASSLVGVSGIHLLKTFINIEEVESQHVMWQVIIHATFLFSSIILSISERVLYGKTAH